MAKKKAAAKKPAKKKAAKKKAGKTVEPKPRPRQIRLEGVEDAPKDRVLDGVCQRLAEFRADLNTAKQGEDQEKGKALARMQLVGIDAYTAHGVELVHTHLDKIRVKLVDDDSGEEGDSGEGTAAGPGDPGYIPGTEEGGAGDVLEGEPIL